METFKQCFFTLENIFRCLNADTITPGLIIKYRKALIPALFPLSYYGILREFGWDLEKKRLPLERIKIIYLPWSIPATIPGR